MHVYKYLNPEEDFAPLNIEDSLERARESLYHAWFLLMKASPWYRAMLNGHEPFTQLTDHGHSYGNESSMRALEAFGDIREQNFNQWWRTKGHLIFAEDVRYAPVNLVSVKTKSGSADNLNSDVPRPSNFLMIQVPLNIDPAEVRRQFDKILDEYTVRSNEYNRWKDSTADVHPTRDTNLTFEQIVTSVKIYELYEKICLEGGKEELPIKAACRADSMINLLVEEKKISNRVLGNDEKAKIRREVDKQVKRAKNMMAQALFLNFPSDSSSPLSDNFSFPELRPYLGYKDLPEEPVASIESTYDLNATRRKKKAATKAKG